MKEFLPPYFENASETQGKTIFLGGSIQMGKTIDWQADIVKTFKDKDITFFNPRRKDWDNSWEQSIDDDNFRTQVLWELDHMLKSDIVIFFISKEGESPISLAEIGCITRPFQEGEMKVIICCEKGFFRRGNIEVMCYKWNIPLIETLDELKKALRLELKNG